MNYEVIQQRHITDSVYKQIGNIASNAYGSSYFDHEARLRNMMQADTFLQVVNSNERVVGYAVYRSLRGGLALETCDMALGYEVQRRGLAVTMLNEYANTVKPEAILAITRSARMARVMQAVCSKVVPFDVDSDLTGIIKEANITGVRDFGYCHIVEDRPDLYCYDPAYLPIEDDRDFSFDFPILYSRDTALVTAGRFNVNGEL